MKLTRTQQLYASVLGLCLFGLVLDRTVLRPADAAAGEKAEPAEGLLLQDPNRPLDTEKLMRGVASPEATLAGRLHEIAEARAIDPSHVQDAFRAPEAWMPDEPIDVVPEWAETAAERFQREHRLNAVMANGDAGWAIIDGKRIRVGEVLDGFTLVAVQARTAVLEAGGLEIHLSLP